MKTRKFLLYVLLCMAAMTSFSSCDQGEEDPVTPPTPPVEENGALCFTAMQDNSTVSMTRTSKKVALPTLEYSFDGEAWHPFVYTETGNENGKFVPVALAKTGDKIYVRNQGKTDALSISNTVFVRFDLAGKIAASGNIMSLLDKDFDAMTKISGDYAFAGLFMDNTALVSAPSLPATELSAHCYHSLFTGSNIEIAPELPATEMKPYCYIWMFNNCKQLREAPALPAATLAEWCYYEMFSECTSLTSAPALPATKMEYVCYWNMFRDCTSLTSAPALPATTLATECYREMFKGCTSLKNAPALPATTMCNYCYNGMFDSCTSLTNAPALPGTALAEGCYNEMFKNCNSLTNAPTLSATTLASLCYGNMFESCTSLTQVQETLPATELDIYCYANMFYNCQSLATLPQLPATELTEYCYGAMFEGCSSATTAPTLPATSLASGCYLYMFANCSNLNHVEVAFSQWPNGEATDCWLDGVSSVGTFVCPANLADERGSGRIPEGWTKTESQTMAAAAKSATLSSPHIGSSHKILIPDFFKGQITQREKNPEVQNAHGGLLN